MSRTLSRFPWIFLFGACISGPEAGTIRWLETTCGGEPCVVLGAAGSGYREKAVLSFRVTKSDSTDPANDDDVANRTQVSFTILGGPAGATVASEGKTDGDGIVRAAVLAGKGVGTFTVRASVAGKGGTTLFADSAPMTIVSSIPSSDGLSVDCSPANLRAWNEDGLPVASTTTCRVLLRDRTGSLVVRATSAGVLTEAGSAPARVDLHVPEGGTFVEAGTFELSTLGPRPLDVAPLGEDPAQYPRPRGAEPSVPEGQLVRNPRDGLVAVVVYAPGEESFFDQNGNGTREDGEGFIDQGEPFVDSNDSGAWELGEPFVDSAPANGAYDPPNGKWDRATTVWSETRVLFSAPVRGASPYSGFFPSPVPDVARGGAARVRARFADPFLNAPSAGLELHFESTCQNARLSAPTVGKLEDGLGIAWDRRLVAAGPAECDPLKPVCTWKALFYGFSGGSSEMTIENAQGAVDGGAPETCAISGAATDGSATATIAAPVRLL